MGFPIVVYHYRDSEEVSTHVFVESSMIRGGVMDRYIQRIFGRGKGELVSLCGFGVDLLPIGVTAKDEFLSITHGIEPDEEVFPWHLAYNGERGHEIAQRLSCGLLSRLANPILP